MKKNETILIKAVSNGFVIQKAQNEPTYFIRASNEYLVFETLDALLKYLRKHFEQPQAAQVD